MTSIGHHHSILDIFKNTWTFHSINPTWKCLSNWRNDYPTLAEIHWSIICLWSWRYNWVFIFMAKGYKTTPPPPHPSFKLEQRSRQCRSSHRHRLITCWLLFVACGLFLVCTSIGLLFSSVQRQQPLSAAAPWWWCLAFIGSSILRHPNKLWKQAVVVVNKM